MTGAPHRAMCGIVQRNHVAILRFKKINDMSQVSASIRHNKRLGICESKSADRIDLSMSHRNYAVAGPKTMRQVLRLVERRLAMVRRKLRQGTILAIEVVCSLPKDTTLDQRAYFVDTVKWIERHFGGSINIVSADVHLDESCPHVHALIVPVIDGRVCGNALLGGPRKIQAWLDRFHAEVAAKYGLMRRGPGVGFDGAAGEIAISCVASSQGSVASNQGSVRRGAQKGGTVEIARRAPHIAPFSGALTAHRNIASMNPGIDLRGYRSGSLDAPSARACDAKAATAGLSAQPADVDLVDCQPVLSC